MMDAAGDVDLRDQGTLDQIEREFVRNRMKRRIQRWLVSGLRHAFLIGMSLVFLIPLFWMVSTALKDRGQTWIFPPVWIPHPFVWVNFPNVFKAGPFLKFVTNTLIILVWNIIGSVISTILVAYGFARLRFPGRNFMFLLMIATMMIPYQVTLIPTFLLFKWMGWYDTYLPLTVPAFFGSAFFIFLTRQYMMTIPFDLDDAARIDGCDRFQVLWRIVMPLCKPPLVLVVVFTFLGVWNDFMGPLIFLKDPAKYTIAIGLNLLKGRAGTDWNLLMAASLMTVIPVLILYFFAQRHIIGGIASIGLKG